MRSILMLTALSVYACSDASGPGRVTASVPGPCTVEATDTLTGETVTVTYEYDVHGRLVRQVAVSRGFEFEIRHTYDERGLRILTESGPREAPATSARRTYDASGLEIRVAVDGDGDGAPDQVTETTRDAKGRPVRIEQRDGDGELISSSDYTYGSGADWLTQILDTDGDGAIDSRTVDTFDDQGRRLRRDFYGDGETIKRWAEYAYDARDNLVSIESFEDAVGLVSRIEWTYDEADNRISEASDTDADGTVDERWTWTYDADGNEIASEADTDGDGSADRATFSTYDADGNLTSRRVEEGGVVTGRETLTYGCWP